MSPTWTSNERKICERLDRAAASPAVRHMVDDITISVERQLIADPKAQLAWCTVPLEAFFGVPSEIRSCWLFVLRAGCITGAERHPNSVQRFMTIRGRADMQTWDGTAWRSNYLRGGAVAVEERWLSIPTNCWHKPVIDASANWTVLSFHTATPEDLIEERAVDDSAPDAGSNTSEVYHGRHAR